MALDDTWMMAVPTETDRDMARDARITAWWTDHNRAVIGYRKSRVGVVGEVRRTEYGILSLAEGIEQFTGSCAEIADPHSGEAIHDMVHAFCQLLNYDYGRLSRGVLATWAQNICEQWGVDFDTGEWKGDV